MLYYEEYGNPDGKPVIFIHGGFSSHKMYENQFAILPEFRKIFIDLPNCGKSQGYTKFSFDTAIEEIIELTELLTPERKIFLVGHSYGGLVVKGLLERIPERIEKAVVGSTNLMRSPMYRFYTSGLGAFLTWGKNYRYYRKEQIPLKLIYETQKSAWKHFEVPKWMRLYSDSGEEAAEAAPDAASFAKIRNTIPVLLLWADGDITDIRKSMEIWKEFFSYVEAKQFEGVGHAFFREHPEMVNPVVEKFMRNKKNSL